MNRQFSITIAKDIISASISGNPITTKEAAEKVAEVLKHLTLKIDELQDLDIPQPKMTTF